jgi:hypothetical protein
LLSDALQHFIRTTVGSAWALELLLLMSRERDRLRTPDELNRELRGSLALVLEILGRFSHAGLVREEGGGFRYAPASDELAALVNELEAEYAARPLTVFKAIVAAPNEKIQTFADAFKVKKD